MTQNKINLQNIKIVRGKDKYLKAIVRGFRQMIQTMYREYDPQRSYHQNVTVKKHKLKAFFLEKQFFPFAEFTEEFFE